MGAVVYRPATLGDAAVLFDVRRRSILALAPPVMSIAEAEAWAGKVTPAGMEQKLRDLEIWMAEREGAVAGWGGIRDDTLEALYTAPEYAGQGTGSALLDRLEGLIADEDLSRFIL